MLAKGSFEILEVELTEAFLQKLGDQSYPKRASENVYYDFFKAVLGKHGDKVSINGFGKGADICYGENANFFSDVHEDHIPLFYQNISAGNINGYLEISRRKREEKGRILFLADCNNHRELITCLREMRACQARRRKGVIANSRRGLAKLLVDRKAKRIQ